MTAILRVLLIVFIWVTLLVWAFTQVRYRITSRHLEVTWLGIRCRRIPLIDIRYVSKRRTALAENWWNTLMPGKRILVIHRRTGWFKNVVITPRRRYAFKAALEKAVQESFQLMEDTQTNCRREGTKGAEHPSDW